MKHPWSAAVSSLVLAAAFSSLVAAEQLDNATNRVVPVTAYEVARVPKTRVFIEARGKSIDEILAFRRSLMEEGATRVNFFVPDVIVCDVPADKDPAVLIKAPGFYYYPETHMSAARASSMSDNMRRATRAYDLAWESVYGASPGDESIVALDDFEDVVRRVPAEVVRASKDLPALQQLSGASAAFTPKLVDQNAEFLIGDVLVRLVMPESNGFFEPSTEDWTQAEMNNVVSGASAACLAFQERFDYLPLSFVFEPFWQAETRYEPIAHNMGSDDLWIEDAMASLGIGKEKDPRLTVHVFNEQGRARYGTDWAYTAFIANSENAEGNVFTNAFYTAYANLGGPYLVIPYPAGSMDPANIGPQRIFSQIYQHEMVHIFWGLDEYVAETNMSSCNSRTGYLSELHYNLLHQGPDGVVRGCPDYVPCIMWLARGDGDRPICRWTAGQMGVADVAPANDVPDVFDMPPLIEFSNAAVETVITPEITLNIKVTSLAKPNLNPFQDPDSRLDYAAPLRSAVLTVGGENVWMTPLDGRWDEVEEDLRFSFTGLHAGLTRVTLRATNSFGRQSSNYVKRIYFVGLNYGQFEIDVVDGAIRFAFNLVGDTFNAKLDLYRIHEGNPILVASGLEGVSPEGSPFTTYRYEDTDVTPGGRYEYYVVGIGDVLVKGSSYHFESTSNVFQVRAMVPIPGAAMMSQPAPNPFRDLTTISVRVPASFAQSPNTTSGPQTATQVPVPTNVEIAVYDVKGRFVQRLHKGAMFDDVFTVVWDGTNQHGDRVSSGIYFIKSEAGPQTHIRKVVVVR